MKYINLFLTIFSPTLSVYMIFSACAKIGYNKLIKLNIKNIFFMVLCGLAMLINTNINNGILRLLISVLLITLLILYYYKEDLLKTIITVITTYIIATFYEIIFSIALIKIFPSMSNDISILAKSIFSFITMLCTYLTCSVPNIQQLFYKIINKMISYKYLYYFVAFIILFLFAIDSINYSKMNISIYLNNIIVVICFISIVIFSINQYIKLNKELEKVEILMTFLTKYEKIIDEHRINKHEMLNNLLILASIDDKNTEEYNQLLKDLIKTYSKTEDTVKNMNKLPSGLKGILYYKLAGLDKEKFKINVNISKSLSMQIKRMEQKDYTTLCKITNILLDNAIEASRESKNKFINIEFYKENNNTIILIENSCKKKVDINKIEIKNYSTKGKGRGLGLYIVNNLLKENDNIEINRSFENMLFSTKLIIK